jgi:hypothetical protein
VICCRGRTPVACASGTTFEAALRVVLEQALLDYQTCPVGQPRMAGDLYAATQEPPTAAPQWPDVAVRERPALPRHLRGTVTREPTEAPPLSVASLVACLAAQGRQPFAVPLDHDQEATAIMPYAVRVVLADA